jgi:RimJ/RimL family protein N-acetyltransferase
MSSDHLLRGDRVVLRPFRHDDAPDLAAGCDDPLTQRFLPLLPRPYTVDDAMWWITEGAPSAFAAGGAAYAVVDPDSDRIIGGAGYGSVRTGSASLGYWVAPWARQRGVATAAARALTAHAFRLGLHRLSLTTDPLNTASQRVAMAAGYQREGTARGFAPTRDGDRADRLVWSRLATDPEGPTPRLLPDLPGRGAPGGAELTDGVVTLRPLGVEDTDDSHALRQLPDVVATSVPAVPPSRESMAHNCATAEAGWLAGQRVDLTIRDAATAAYAGEIGLYYWEPSTQQAMIGYSLVPAWRGRGYATRAARLISTWAFENTDIARIIAGTAPDNIGSQRVLQRAGFVQEGYQRARLPGPDGSRIDDILFALLPESLT